MKNKVWTKFLVCGIIVLFVGTSVLPSIGRNIERDTEKISDMSSAEKDTGANLQIKNPGGHGGARSDEGLVGYWNFDEGTGSISHDVSGNGNDGTIYGAQWTSGISGGGLYFDGDDYVEIPDNSNINFNRNNDYGFDFWFNTSASTQGGFAQIIAKRTEEDPVSIHVQISPYNQIEVCTGLFTYWLVRTPSVVNDGKWHYLAMNHNGSNCTFTVYYDGVNIGMAGPETIDTYNLGNLYLGRDVPTGRYFNGFIDEVTIYNRALTTEEMQEHYQGYYHHCPYIISCQPSGITAGNVSSIYLNFNQPMNESSFSIGEDIISFIGPQGSITINNFSWITPNKLKLIFEPQSIGGRYILIIGSQIFNVSGIGLDQDKDGIPGETPDDYFTVSFTIDSTGPRVTRNNPSGDIAGTFSYVDVWFSEKINLSTLPSSVIITGPDGSITPSSISEIGLNCYRINIPDQITYGIYTISIMSTVEDVVGNKMDQDRDGIQGESSDDIYSFSLNLVDVDLILSNVTTSEPVFWAGETMNISWDGANYGGMPLLGDWTDAVYFSDDHHWDINDVLLGTIHHTGGLLEDEDYSASINVVIPGALPGDYYIIVRADLYNQEKEGGDEGNNIVPVGPIPLDVRSLTIDGVQVNGSMNDVDWVDYFAIAANSSRNFAVIVDEISTGLSVEVFVSYETVPDRLNYEYSSASNPRGEQQVLIGGSLSGMYYVFVYAKQLTGVGSYHIKAVDLGDIYLSDISPETSGVITKCTMTLSGVGFNHNTSIEYIGPDLNIHTPDDIQLISSTTLTAVLDVPTWPQEVYDVVVRNNDNASSELIDAFEVTPGVPYLDARLIVPSWVGRHAFSTLWIEYKNTGNSSMPAPLFKLNGTENAILTIDSSIERNGLWTDNPPTGTNDTVWVMANGSGMTPGILQPGDTGRIPVYYLGLKTPWSWSGSVVFNLAIVDPDNNDLINWDFFKNEMRPYWWIGDDAWHAIWLNYIDLVGNHWLTYLEILNTNANYLKRIGSETNDPRMYLSFEFRKADGLNPIRNLETAVDINIPSPGLPLSFSRMYQQPISRRYQLGVLGRGWTNSWDVHFMKNTDGDIAIFDDTGTPRIFDNINNNYEGQPGDHGVLTSTGGGSLSLRELNELVTTFNSDGSLNYFEDPNGNRITAEYDTGQLMSLTHSNGDQLLIDYNANGRIWHVTDPRGPDSEDDYVVTYEYDSSGEYLVRMIEPGNRVTNYTYELAGTLQQRHALLCIEYPDSTDRYFRYNTKGWLNETYMDSGAEVITFNYSLYSVVVMKDATERQVKFWFGSKGNIVKISDGADNTISLNNDDLKKEVIITGPSGEKFSYLYDKLGNTIGIKNPLYKDTTFNYESSFNRLDSVTDARGNKILYDYDSSGNLDTITYEDGNSESFTYGSSGNILNWTNSRNNTIGYTYNTAGQITSKDYPDTPGIIDYIYSYDDARNLISARDSHGTTNFTYDPDTDWLIRIDYPGGKFFVFNYNEAGQRTKRIDQDGYIVNYMNDNVGRLDQITNTTNALVVDYDYDASGRLLQKTLGNGVYTTYEYDNVGSLIHLVNYNPTDAIISRFDYTYDISGRRTSMTTLNGTFYYTYDLLGQLISVIYPDNHVVEYVYDAVGNRIKVIDNGTSTIYSTNEMNQYTNVGGITYTYDNDGNMISKTEAGVTTTYTYDFENHLIGVTTPTDGWTYSYDAFGNRIKSNHNGIITGYIIDPIGFGNLATECDVNGTIIARYDYGLGLLERIDPLGTLAYYNFEATGSTTELTDSSGAVLNSYSYDPFGVHIKATETLPNNFEYIGEFGVLNEAEGLQFMRTRFYDPMLGRFLSKDLISTTEERNPYTYVGNLPTMYIDPSGLCRNLFSEWGNSLRLRDINPDDLTLRDLEHYLWTASQVQEAGKHGRPWQTIVSSYWMIMTIGYSVAKISFLGSVLRLLDIWKTTPPTWQELVSGLRGTVEGQIIPFCGWTWNPPNNPNATTKPIGEGGSGIASSVDPNDKAGPNGYGGAKYISETDQLMPYMICFENQQNATGPAQIIRIIDTLDDDLNLSTFELVDIAFADQVIDISLGLDHYETSLDLTIDNEYVNTTELRCEIDVSLDYETRNLTFEMIGLDPNTGWLPENVMLGILYPDDESGRGEGHITYLIEHLEDPPTGTEITNKASIYFDWNDPIDTPLTLNTIDAGVPTSHVNPLPPIVNDSSIIVSWTGEDETNGSGIAYFDVYVSDNNGTYMAWLVKSTLTEETFYGEPDHTYSFYSIAIDNVGHAETAPEEPDATVLFYLAVLANFTYAPATPSVGEEITFDASFSYDPDGFITNYHWDFDDGNVTNTSNPIITHTYNSAGDFSVTLTVTDNNGNHDSFSKTIPVSATFYITSLLYHWNFISLPFNQSVDKTNLLVKYNGSEYTWQDAVNQGIVLGFIYEWNRTGQRYELTDTLIPGDGYWMYAYHDCELWTQDIIGFVTDNHITDLYPSWNIMGVPDGEPVEKQNLTILYNGTMYTWQEAVTNNIILGFIYLWDETGQNYQLTDILQPGKSYWMYAYYNCTLLRPTI
jgi:RHS repeat-associated protein